MKRLIIGATFIVAASGCAAPAAEVRGTGSAVAEATADVRNAVGQSKAQAVATQVGDSVRVRVTAEGMPAGNYGAHVHAAGRCDAPDFTSAGPHWNPTNRQHGKNNPNGQHHGDLPNLAVGTNGRGTLEVTIPRASLVGGSWPAMLDPDGASLVIHAQPDDYRTDPSGNSGNRIACGVFR